MSEVSNTVSRHRERKRLEDNSGTEFSHMDMVDLNVNNLAQTRFSIRFVIFICLIIQISNDLVENFVIALSLIHDRIILII